MGGRAAAGCPICGRDVSKAADNKSRPFCSPQCKVIDLDRWLSGGYRVPGPPVEASGYGMHDSGSNGFEVDHSLGQSFERKGDEDL